MIGQLSLFIRMMRLKVVVTLWTFMLLGLARHTAHLTSPRLGAALLALGAGYAAATTANDIADVGIDRVNRPRDAGRPLVTGDATIADLWRTNAIAAGVAVAAAIPLGATGMAIVGTSLLVSYAYSVGPIRLSHRWTLAPIALAIAMSPCRTRWERRSPGGDGNEPTHPWSVVSSSCSSRGSS
jgi:4-hydroxybenzoate polyprenyltransferase